MFRFAQHDSAIYDEPWRPHTKCFGVRRVLASLYRERCAIICEAVDNSKLKAQDSQKAAEQAYESRLPGPLARMKQWLVAHHMTLMAIADTPHSIALGSAIGVFFGFTPLWSIKTLLSIGVAWVCRCNKIAAAIAVTLHDVLIFVMPAIYFAEYKVGCWILRRPVPLHRLRFHFGLHDYLNTGLFVRLVWPAFVGSLFFALPSAIIVYFVMRLLISRARTLQKTV
jgi:hypothetical protein